MNKFLVLFLSIILMVSLTACNGETLDINEKIDSVQSENNKEDRASENNEVTKNNEISFTELVVVDNSECLIKLTEIYFDPEWGCVIKTQLENRSSDKRYSIIALDASIDGIQCETSLGTIIDAGEKVEEEIIFFNDYFEEIEVYDYTDIEMTFDVSDCAYWSDKSLIKETVHVFPFGEENAIKFVRKEQESDKVIIDNEYATVVVTGYDPYNSQGYAINMFWLNKTDKNLIFYIDDDSYVNGYKIGPQYAIDVSAGKCAFSSVYCHGTMFYEYNIVDVEEFKFTLRVSDYDDETANDLINKIIILNP